MPDRQYFYTPILVEQHNNGATDAEGDYIQSNSCSPASQNPENPMEMVIPVGAGMICLRADDVNGRCVVSLPMSTNQLTFPGGNMDMMSVSDWSPKSRSEIQAEYNDPDPNSPNETRQIDFTVEEGN